MDGVRCNKVSLFYRVIYIIVGATAFSIIVFLLKSSVIILQKVVVVFLWDVTVVVRVESEINDEVPLAIRKTRCVNSLSYIAKPM
jgi:hypothetical protein